VSSTVNPALLGPGALPAGSVAPGPKPGGVGAVTGPRRDDGSRPSATAPASAATGPSFADVLQQTSIAPETGTAQPLRFSRHALERVQRRGIELGPSTMTRLQDGVGRAAGKGSRDSVVLVDGTAFVVAVGSRTVVTAVGAEHMREHVFTNIDSAVIA
jgi:flagellar operon protein